GKGLLELPGSFGRELEQLEGREFKVVRLDGIRSYKCQKSHFMDRGFRHHFIMIQEITDEILHSEKEAYEKVIRMMSHEINNSIGSVNSILNSCLTYKNYLPEADSDDYITALQVAIDRNVSLNRFMAGLADVVRIPKPMKETCDFHRLLDSVHLLLSAEIKIRGLKWEWRLNDLPFEIHIDVQQFEQVLLNIFRNSIEAIGEEGKITVITEAEPVKQLIIQDDGCGISPDIQQQLFNPFFSTKKNGKGVGLTLIREILMAHGFRFSLETTEEGNTEFKIVFDNT
ncbi:MAG: ATP-binding protein, partial [FCB group bacterium]|nr:ATP-binding protein [FCB group bacterium]